jgi:hypothetical protein
MENLTATTNAVNDISWYKQSKNGVSQWGNLLHKHIYGYHYHEPMEMT